MWGILVAVVALFGAAWAQTYAPGETPVADIPEAETGDVGAIRSIAIVSALGGEFRIADTAGNRNARFATDWNADGLVAATLRRYLAGRFRIVEPAVDRDSLRDAPTRGWLARQVDPGADAWLLVRPVGDPTPGPAGIGLRRGQGAALCANYEIELIDARSREIIASAVSRMRDHRGMPPAFACYEENAALASEAIPKAETLAALRRQLAILLPRSLVETLRAMKLDVALPPPGDHSIAPPEAPVDTASIATVAVVSAIGDGFTFANPRDLLRAGASVQTMVPEWRIDAEVERVACAALARRFPVKIADIDRAALARVVLKEGKPPRIDGLTPSAQIDAYVLIVKAFRAHTNSSGPGLWHEGTFFGKTYAFVNYAVVLVDARTLKVLKAALPAMKPESATAYPLVPVANEMWPEGAKDRAAAEKSRATISELIEDSVPETLYQMGLTKD